MTDKHGLVSIIMPNFNCGKFIEQSINSVLAQTYPNWELIVVDDCSTDGSIIIAERLAMQDGRIRLLKNEKNCGAAISRNWALCEARGRWIAFLDSDDLWLPEKLEKQLEFMEKTDCQFCYHNYEEIDEEGNMLGVMVSGINNVGKWGMYSCCWPGCLTVMYDREKIGLVQINDIRRNNDTAIWLKVVEKAPCYLLKENLAQYRRRKNSITTPSLWDKIWAHYPLFRTGMEMNPIHATFWTLMNVLGNGWKKMWYVSQIKY